MIPEIINTHEADALKRILEQYKTAPGLKSIMNSYNRQVQIIEDLFADLRTVRSIYESVGKQLDLIGLILGVKRPNGVGDNLFRVILYGQAAAIGSQGEPESVIEAYRAMTFATNVRIEEDFPAKINIFSDGTLTSEMIPYVGKYLRKCLPAGVLLGTFGIFSGSGGGFGFNENPSALGFGDLNDPSVGGGLGSLVG